MVEEREREREQKREERKEKALKKGRALFLRSENFDSRLTESKLSTITKILSLSLSFACSLSMFSVSLSLFL
jgi:hypothetical protein